ncbi:MAG TPA: AAA family ATPase, partial [Solirubrobacteraceae bacterium]
MATVARPTLLEREAEHDELVAGARDAERGRGRLVVVEGPAGIGKTRLLRETRERAARAGMRVLAARASELEGDFPFAVVRQLLEPALAGTDEPSRRELLGGAAASAATVVGLPPDTASGEGSADPSFATLNGLYWLVFNLTEAAPTLVAVDDAHWCDQASLRFLSFLAPRLEDLPVLLVVATRPAGRDAALARLAADPAARLLRPRTLSDAAVAELVRAALSAAASDEYCAAIAHATGGNPFLVHELLAQLAADGASGAAEEAAHVRDVVPATIAHAVLVRLARAPEPARRLAQALAVLGDGAEVRLAAALAELAHDAAAEAADALVAAGVLEPGRPLRFAHPLLRAAVYDDTPAAWRAACHARAAELLRAEQAEPERIAVHLVATDPGDSEAVVGTLRRAARRALDRAAPESAVTYLKRALREGRGDRDELARMLVTAGLRATDPAAFDDIGFDLVGKMLADPAASTAVAAELGIWLYAGGRRREGARLLEQAAAAAARAGDHDLAMRLAAQHIASDQTPLSKARARMAAYGARVEPASPGERLYYAMEAYAAALGAERAAVDLARRGLEDGRIFVEQPDSPAPYGALWVLLFADELDEAGRTIVVALHDARERRDLLAIMLGTAFRGRLAHQRGDVAAAEADLRSAVELIRVHNADVRALP